MKNQFKCLILSLFFITSFVSADATNTPIISISSSTTSFTITEGTDSVSLILEASEAPNKNNIIVTLSNTCNVANETGTIALNTTSKTITIFTTLYTPGTCTLEIISAVGSGAQRVESFSSTPAIIIVSASGNTAPVAIDDSYSTGLNTSYSGNVLTNDSDSDGDTLSVSANTSPSHGSVSIDADGDFTYTPTIGYLGTDSFTYTISDGNGGTDTGTVTMTIYDPDANTPPNAVDDTYTTAFETDLTANVLDNDTDADGDGDTLEVIANTNPVNGTVTVNEDGSFTYIPNIGYSGSDSFTYTISDGNGGTDTATVSITVETSSGFPTYDNTSVCGLFSNVLTTYDHLESGGNNDQVCNTENIAYPNGEITGDIICHEDSACAGTGQSCERVDPPSSRYSHDFPDNNLSGTTATLPSPAILQDYNYGDINYGGTLTLNPQTTYNNSTIKVMLLGHVVISSGTLNLEPGDYYFDSLTFDGNNNNLILPSGGVVRIFVKGDLAVAMNNLSFNADAGSSESNLFVYVAGNFESIGNGGGTTAWKAFMYVEGSVELSNNSNNWKIYGGITAEGRITIEGNNPDFIGTGDAGNLGVADCVLCFDRPHSNGQKVSTGFIIYDGDADITNLVIQKAYDYTYTTTGSPTVTTGIASEESVTVDIDGLVNFPNPTTTDGFKYVIGNYSSDHIDTVTDTTTVPFDLEDYNTSILGNVKALYLAEYTEAGFDYHVMVERCTIWNYEAIYTTGLFDAWDTFRNIDDRNISTKIANKPYNITIASLNDTQDATEAKAGIDIQYNLVDMDTNIRISGPYAFNADAFASDTSALLQVASAHRRVAVEFEVCADYNGTAYTLYSHGDAQCRDTTPIPANTLPGDVRFRLFSSSDLFAVRPDSFNIAFDTAGELTSAISYDLTTNAIDESGGATLNYDQDSDLITKTPNLLLSDGTDGTNLMEGSLSFNTINFIGGSSSSTLSNELNVSFDNVGQVQIHFEDRNWAAVDFDDSPSDCNETRTFNGISDPNLEDICFYGDGVPTTFIPDHFKVDGITLGNHRTGNFTYLSDDLNMSAHVGATITAENAAGGTTTNFDANPLLYGNAISVDLNVTDWNPSLTNLHPLGNSIHKKDLTAPSSLAFSSGVLNITESSNILMFNYDRNQDEPVLPFDVPAADINVSVSSTYATANITGTGASGSGAATFLYARAKSTKANDYYDTIPVSTTVITPVQVLIFCQEDPGCATATAGIVNLDNTSTQWWVITEHDETLQDGNISLVLNAPIPAGASITPQDPTQVDTTLGIDNNVVVTCSSVPSVLDINLAAPTTNSWLIYKPNPLYKVRCYAPSNWTGRGETGHVVGTGASVQKNTKANW